MTSSEAPGIIKPSNTVNIDGLMAGMKPLDLTDNPIYGTEKNNYFDFYSIDFENRFSDVRHYFGSISSAPFTLATHYFKHNEEVATCFIVHGYFDHSGLYEHIIEYCLTRRYSVVIFDLPGHGLSGGEPASINDFEQYQQALRSVLDRFKEDAVTPWYAIGQSTGAAILMDFLLTEKKPLIEKAVLLAPLLKPKNWSVVNITHRVARLIFKQLKRKFRKNSQDEKFLHFLKFEDPLQTHSLSLQWVGALANWIQYFQGLAPINFPLLVVQGKEDTTVDWRFNLPIIHQKFGGTAAVYLSEAGHQLANESEDIRKEIYLAMDRYFKTIPDSE